MESLGSARFLTDQGTCFRSQWVYFSLSISTYTVGKNGLQPYREECEEIRKRGEAKYGDVLYFNRKIPQFESVTQQGSRIQTQTSLTLKHLLCLKMTKDIALPRQMAVVTV